MLCCPADLVRTLLQASLPCPCALVQPEVSARSWFGRGQGDPIFTDSHGNLLKDQLDRQERIRAYAGDGDLKDPLLSPLWAKDFAGLPPMMLLAADEVGSIPLIALYFTLNSVAICL